MREVIGGEGPADGHCAGVFDPDGWSAVSIRVTDVALTSDKTGHSAVRAADGLWSVSWLPGLRLRRGQAVTAMVLAETAASKAPGPGHRWWPLVQRWAEELGLTGIDAMTLVLRPPEEV